VRGSDGFRAVIVRLVAARAFVSRQGSGSVFRRVDGRQQTEMLVMLRLRWVFILLVAGWVVGGAPGAAHATRFALFIGNDVGQGPDVRLRFAESDTTRLSGVMSRFGGFPPSGTIVLLGRNAAEVRTALGDVAERLRTTPGEHLVLVYYSGHADAQSLHLGSSSLPLTELKEIVTKLPAAARILILDACQAGVLTRAKGGQPGRGFEVSLAAPQPEGIAILASSTGSEMAQESDQLAGSVFTHFFRIGLTGLADRNRDGAVSLVEVFDYVSERTLAATIGTTTGPQHPTFRLDIAGREDLVLTRPGLASAGFGHVKLDVPGWYFVHRPDGTIAAETVSRGGEMLALEAGQYEITRRERAHLDVAAVAVNEGGSVAISASPSRHVAFGRMVRKGGGRSRAYGLAAMTGLRTPLTGMGLTVGASLSGRVDFNPASVELRLGLGRAQETADRLETTTWDTTASVALLRLRDAAVRRTFDLSWGVGLELGVSHLRQVLDDGERRPQWSPLAGPVALLELAVSKRFSLRADLGVPVYLLRVQPPSGIDETVVRPAVRFGLGGGVSF
jgi:hypothetical protein